MTKEEATKFWGKNFAKVNAQAMFNLAHMYAHGLGLSRDFHLAKRHYDMAAESATEAYAPVKLAMLELTLMIGMTIG